MIIDKNFSEFCYALNGNMAYEEQIDIIFILPDINYTQRTACQNCTIKYGIPSGETVPKGCLPVSLHSNGDLYFIVGYYQVIDILKTLDINVNINLYITDINSVFVENNQPIIKNGFKLSSKYHALEIKKRVTAYYVDPKQENQSFPLYNYFELELISSPLTIDFKSILHIGNYIKNKQQDTFFKTCLQKRAIVRDVNIAYQSTNIHLEDHMHLAHKVSNPEHQLATYNGLIPSEVGDFIAKHHNVLMGYLNEGNEPTYLYFNKNHIKPLEYISQLYNFVSIYMNEVDEMTVKSPILYAIPQSNQPVFMTRAFIYDNELLSVGLNWEIDKRYLNISFQPKFTNLNLQFHELNSLKILKQVKDKLTRLYPCRSYIIDYYTVGTKLKLASVRTLRTTDLGLISSLIDHNAALIDNYICNNNQYIQEFNITPSLIDTLVTSQLRDLMHGFARNKYLINTQI